MAPLTGLSWGINMVNLLRPVDLIFEMHDEIRWHQKRLKGIKSALETKTPVYSIGGFETYGFKRYPVEAIINEFGEDYFGCSIDYMLAFAIYGKFEKVDVYGVNLVCGTEYYYERPSVEFWRGYAKGRGIDIKFHGSICEVGKTKMGVMYGYETPQQVVAN